MRKFTLSERSHVKIYGKNSWVIITGAGGGQGKDHSLEFAKRGFNILLVGNNDCLNVEKIIKRKYPNVQTHVILVDFVNSHKKSFFDPIKKFIKDKDICGLVSNIGMRYGFSPYHKINSELVGKIINAKGTTQAKFIKLALSKFIHRNKDVKSFIIVISALVCGKNSIYTNDNIMTLPYVSIYEGINAFSFTHAKSLYEEIKYNPIYKNVDFLNITPAGVITPNTEYFLKNEFLAVKSKYFVKCVIKLLGNYNGTTCGCIEHLIASYLPAIIPMGNLKDKILRDVGLRIANHYK